MTAPSPKPTGKRKLDQLAPTSANQPVPGKNSTDLQLALPVSDSQPGKCRKIYKYSVDELKRIRSDQYRLLHSVVNFFKEQKYPDDVTTATQRQNFKRRQAKFAFVDGVLYRRKGPELLRVLWENEIQPTLLEINEKGSHYPKDQGKFRQLVESVFYFPQLAVVSRAFLLSYDDCQKEKAGRAGRTDREIYPTPPVDPFFRVHVDLLGPVQRSRNHEFKYVMLAIDPVTKHSCGRGLKDNKAATVAQAFREEILLRHGCPFQIVTDRGTEFNKELIAEQLKKEGLNHVLIRTRNPKANVQVERPMSVVKSQLRILCDSEPTAWDEHIPRIIFQYNVSYQVSIKTSPFVALFGRKPIIPAHHLFGASHTTPPDQEIEPTLDDQLVRFETLRTVQQQVKVHIEEAQTKAKEKYARWNSKKRKRIDNLTKGDFALMQKPGTIRGFQLHWKGPYQFKGWTSHGEDRVAVLQDAQGRGVEVVKYYSHDQFSAEFLSLSSRFPVQSRTPDRQNDAPTLHDFDLNQVPPNDGAQANPVPLTQVIAGSGSDVPTDPSLVQTQVTDLKHMLTPNNLYQTPTHPTLTLFQDLLPTTLTQPHRPSSDQPTLPEPRPLQTSPPRPQSASPLPTSTPRAPPTTLPLTSSPATSPANLPLTSSSAPPSPSLPPIAPVAIPQPPVLPPTLPLPSPPAPSTAPLLTSSRATLPSNPLLTSFRLSQSPWRSNPDSASTRRPRLKQVSPATTPTKAYCMQTQAVKKLSTLMALPIQTPFSESFLRKIREDLSFGDHFALVPRIIARYESTPITNLPETASLKFSCISEKTISLTFLALVSPTTLW